MINRVYRLMDTSRIDMVLREVELDNKLVVSRPKYLSICAADQRYFQGKRKRETMRRKLPMALIHEATAVVLNDPTGRFSQGAYVVPVPLITHGNTAAKPNYDEQSEFRSSGKDGFLCDFITSSPDELIEIDDKETVIFVFSELVSVVCNALEAFEQSCVTEKASFGVWGDGSMGYVVGVLLRCLYPQTRLYVFGKTMRKLHRFSFADDVFLIDDVPQTLRIGHAFECAGDVGSEVAVRQIINLILPQGCIALLGVSEEEVSVNTRVVLEKGLRLIGNSRSSTQDFRKAVGLISTNIFCRKHLETLVSEIVEIRCESDIKKFFEQDLLNDFKTVGKWLI